MFWLYAQQNASETCPTCLEQSDNLLLHYLFECDKSSHTRTLIFNEMYQLNTRSAYYTNHHLFIFLDEWLHNHNVHTIDTDIFHQVFVTCMSPTINSKGFNFDNQTRDILCSLLLSLAAFTIPHLRSILQPLQWTEIQNTCIIDMQDALRRTYLSLSRSRSGIISLATTNFTQATPDTQFPIFASARTRKMQPSLQACDKF